MSSNGGVRQPGWYPDPEMKDTKRYWDGEKWTDQVSRVEPSWWVAQPVWFWIFLVVVLVIAGFLLAAELG